MEHLIEAHSHRQGDYLRDIDALVEHLVNMSGDIHKLDLNPAGTTLKKIATAKLASHLSLTKAFIDKINSVNK